MIMGSDKYRESIAPVAQIPIKSREGSHFKECALLGAKRAKKSARWCGRCHGFQGLNHPPGGGPKMKSEAVRVATPTTRTMFPPPKSMMDAEPS